MRKSAIRRISRVLATYNDVMAPTKRPQAFRPKMLWVLIPTLSLLGFTDAGNQPVKNAGFESTSPTEAWQIDPDEAKQQFSISLDKSDTKKAASRCWFRRIMRCSLRFARKYFFPSELCGD